MVKNLPVMLETWVQSLSWEDPLENGKATHSSVLAWRVQWAVWSMRLQRVDRTERLSLSLQGHSSTIRNLAYCDKNNDMENVCTYMFVAALFIETKNKKKR